MSWRYEIFKWDANRGGLCDAGCLMLMFSLEYKKNLCHFIWIKKKKSENEGCECEFFRHDWQDNGGSFTVSPPLSNCYLASIQKEGIMG